MSQLKKGAILSYLNIGITNIMGLILTPFIIRSLGNSEYGLYILIGSIVSYVSLLDLGLNNTIIRYVSKYRAEKDKEGEEIFLATTMFIYAFISLITVAIGFFLYFNLEQIFGDSLTTGEMVKAKKMFLVLIFNLAITLPGGTFTAVCNAYERFVFPRVLLIIKYLSRAATIFTLLFYFPYAMTLVWIDTILNVTTMVTSAFYVFKILKVRFKMHHWNRRLVKDIFSYSIWVLVTAIVARLQWNAGQITLGISSNTATVAIFGVGIMLGSYYAAFASAINTLLLPKATKMSVSQNNAKAYNSAMQKVGRVNGFILFLILSGFYVYGKDFIILWVGKTYLPSWEIAFLVMIAMTLPLIQWFGNSILEAKKKNRFRSLVSLVTVTIAVLIAIFLAPKYQFQGVIYPLFIAMMLNSFLMSWYYFKIFGFDFTSFIKNTILQPLFLGSLPIIFVFSYLKNYWNVTSWLDLALHIALFGVSYLLLVYFVIMNSEEKEIILGRL
jgi:O-antigen/teichoic acid export membrane protein